MRIYLYHRARYGQHPVQLSFGRGTNAKCLVRKPLCLLCATACSTLTALWVKTPLKRKPVGLFRDQGCLNVALYSSPLPNQFEIGAAELSCCGKNGMQLQSRIQKSCNTCCWSPHLFRNHDDHLNSNCPFIRNWGVMISHKLPVRDPEQPRKLVPH